jgi:outer membrane protein assembly factor BamB
MDETSRTGGPRFGGWKGEKVFRKSILSRIAAKAAIISWALLSPAASHGAALWIAPTAGDIWDLEATGDLDGDGKADIVAGAADNAVRALSGATGTIIWTVRVGGDVWCVASFPDLDGDGKKETVAGTGANEVLLISGTGALLWTFSTLGDVWSLVVAGDATGDGVPELACGSGDNNVYLLDLKGKAKIWSRDVGGDVWSVASGKDLDGDGVPDIAAGTGADTVVALSGRRGEVLWKYGATADAWSVLVTGDANGDGTPDVLAGTGGNRVLCLSGKPGPGGPGGQGGARIIWQSMTGSDIRVLATMGDRDGDGLDEVLAGGLDNVLRLLAGKDGTEIWSHTATGAIEDAIRGPDIDGDGTADAICATDGSTVEAVSGKTGKRLWRSKAALEAAYWSLAPLPDLDGDGKFEIAAGSAANEIIAIPGLSPSGPDPIDGFSCVASETPAGGGVLLAWTDAAGTGTVRLREVTGGANILLGEVPAGVGKLLVPIAGSMDPRDFTAVNVAEAAPGQMEESTPELCTATLSPPPVANLGCTVDASRVGWLAWTLPDPGLRQLDGVKVVIDGLVSKTLPPTAAGDALGILEYGIHSVVVTTLWESWESPTFTCTLSVMKPGERTFIRGDANGDKRVDIADPITILDFLFKGDGIPCNAAADSDGSRKVDLTDGVSLLSYLFIQGDPPATPYPSCGVPQDDLDCASFPACP